MRSTFSDEEHERFRRALLGILVPAVFPNRACAGAVQFINAASECADRRGLLTPIGATVVVEAVRLITHEFLTKPLEVAGEVSHSEQVGFLRSLGAVLNTTIDSIEGRRFRAAANELHREGGGD